MKEIFIQALGLAGFIFGILAFQSDKHKNIVFCKILNELLFGIQYIFLGAFTGAVMNGLSCVRNAVFIRSVQKGKSNKPWIVLFIVIIGAYGIISWESWLSAIPIAAKILTTIAYGIKDTRKVRMLNFPSSAGWLIYNSIYHSVFGAVNEVFTLISLIIAVVRFDIMKKTEKSSRNNETQTP